MDSQSNDEVYPVEHSYNDLVSQTVHSRKAGVTFEFTEKGIVASAPAKYKLAKVSIDLQNSSIPTETFAKAWYSAQTSAADREDAVQALRSLTFDTSQARACEDDTRRENNKRARVQSAVTTNQAKLKGPEVRTHSLSRCLFFQDHHFKTCCGVHMVSSGTVCELRVS